MKIAVLHRYPPRQAIGTNASFVEFLQQLVSNKHKVFYITYRDKNGVTPIKGVTFLALPFYFDRGNSTDKKIKTWLWIFLVPFFVLYYNFQNKFDLVYCDDSVPIYGFLIKLLNFRTKVVIRLGDLQTGYSLSDDHPLLFSISQFFEVGMWKMVDGVVAISEPFKRYLISRHLSQDKISVVEESVNLSDTSTKIHRSSRPVTFSFHGALLRCKGLETLIEAYQIVKARYPNIKLTIAGGGDQEVAIRRLIEKKKLADILFTGWYNHNSLEKILENVDIGIVMRSSNMANNFVVTTCLLENWSKRIPVIAPKLSAFAGVIKDRYNGILFEPGNAKDLAKKMIFMLKNVDKWTYMGDNGHTSAKKTFDHRLIAKKMVTQLEGYIKRNEKK